MCSIARLIEKRETIIYHLGRNHITVSYDFDLIVKVNKKVGDSNGLRKKI